MSKEEKIELKNLEQPLEELATEAAEQVEGGIIIIGGKPLMTSVNPLSQVSLNSQALTQTNSGG